MVTFVIYTYHKIPIISPGLIFVQKAFLMGLFSGRLNFGGALLLVENLHFKMGWA